MRYEKGFSIANQQYPSPPQGQAMPLVLQGAFARLDTAHQALSHVHRQLQEQCENLSRDWSTRGKPFWQQTLALLKELKASVSPLTDVGQDVMNDPGCLIEMRYTWMLNMNHILAETDKAGMQVTSYIPVCASKSESRLQQRRRIFETLKRLSEDVEDLLPLIGLEGQRQCLEQFNQNREKAVPSSSRLTASKRVRERRRRWRGARR